MSADTLAIDFGTSNSAVAILHGDRPLRLAIEEGAQTLPTAVFFPANGGEMRIGAQAAKALIEGEDGRYMRALKSVLGAPLLHESRPIGGKRRTLADVVTAFLVEVKQRAEARAGREYSRVLSGRPVHFHTADPDRDAQAEADLRACYHAAGFEHVSFLPEPEAAALTSHRLGQSGKIGLIVDIGGGTSDFSVFRTGATQISILANHGIRLGGTDFDRTVSLAYAMPQLGHKGMLRREMGPGVLPMPKAIFADLASWAKIPFLYTQEKRREVAQMLKYAVEPKVLGRLATVLESELGHELAFAVERGKIAANAGQADAQINMRVIEPGLTATIPAQSLGDTLAEHRKNIGAAARETLRMAGVTPDQVSTVILVGGSSLMGIVVDEARAICPDAQLEYSEAFTAVVDGLALATAR